MASPVTIDVLPDEMLLEIFAYLSKEDLVCSVQHVTPHWRGLALDFRLWQDFTFRFPTYKTNRIIALLKKMPWLKSFAFNERMDIDRIVDTLCHYCKEITHLDTCATPGLVPKHWASLTRHLQDVECLYVHPASLALEPHILCQFPKLKKLKSTAAVPDHYNASLPEGRGCRDIEDFEIMSPSSGFCYPQRVISNNLQTLISLNLYGVQDSVFPMVPLCQRLESLNLNFSSNICGSFRSTLPLLGKLQNLKSLCLRGFVDNNRDILCQLFVNGNLSSLEELDLSNCMNFSVRVATSIAQCCRGLQVLNLKGCANMNDACLEKLARCRDLQVLNLSGCSSVTERGLAQLAMLRQLDTLRLAWMGVLSQTALDALSVLFNLRKLDLDMNTMQEDDVLNMARRMPSLKYLSLFRCPDLDPGRLQQELRSVRINSAQPYFQVNK